MSSGREPGAENAKAQSATALFDTVEARESARRRLQGLELAGQVLQATLVDKGIPQNPPLPKSDPPPLPPGPPPVELPSREVVNAAYAPVPLAPHLGWAFCYGQKDDEKISVLTICCLCDAAGCTLRRRQCSSTNTRAQQRASCATLQMVCVAALLFFVIRHRLTWAAVALIALPKFYTQVLHLMNKMNLPTPFEEDAIPGRFSANRMERKAAPTKQVEAQIVEEDDDSEEDQVTATPAPSLSRKRSRNDDDGNGSSTGREGANPADKGEQVALKRQSVKAPRIEGDISQLSKAFDIKASSNLGQAPPRPGVMTEAELMHRRRSAAGVFLNIVLEVAT